MDPVLLDPSCCLFLDVDGTLIDIAERPEAVVVPGALIDSLDRVSAGLGGAVALISGRTIDNLDELFQPLRLCASGVHGAEVRLRAGGPIDCETDDVLPSEMTAQVEALAVDMPGTLVENKRFSVAVHFRQRPETGPRLRAILEGLVADADDPLLRIMPGHMVFEIKRATFDKGLAIRRFLAHPPFAGRIPVFLGDDVTDRPGFAAALEGGGQALSVGGPLPGTTGSFPDPAAVRSWLAGYSASEKTRG